MSWLRPLPGEADLGQVGATLTQHSRDRVTELGFSIGEIVECLAHPEQSYPSGPDYPGDRRLYQRGGCCIVLEQTDRTIVTILLRRIDRWEHGRHRAA